MIRRRRESIVSAWEVAVRALRLPANLPGPLLRDEVPEVVDRIATLLTTEPPPAPVPRINQSEEHALQRLGIGFELAHLLMEYSVLRNCILEATADERLLTLDELLALNRAIDSVANSSIERFMEASERLLKALDRISAEAPHSKNLDELLHRLLLVLMHTSSAVDSVAILLKQDGVLQVRAAEGLIAERDASFTIAVGEGFAGTIAARCEPMLSRSAENDPLVKSEFIKLRHIQALYGVPLVDTEVIGVAHMGSLSVHDFTHEEKLLFQAMATRASSAIVHTQLLERLEGEQRLLLSTVHQMPIGVVIRGASGELIVANEAAERMFGGEVPPSWRDVPQAWMFVDREGQELSIRDWPLSRALRGAELTREETIVKWLDGTTRTFATSAAPVRDREGRTVAGVMVFEDITERKHAEREREIFIGTVSHDLRTPLAVIRMAAEALLARGRQGHACDPKALGHISSNAVRMDRLIEQLLDFARSRHGGGLPISPRPTDLLALSRQLIDSLHDARVQLHGVGSVVGNWDPDRLSQLLQNLIGNALEHGCPNTPVDVEVRAEDDRGLLRVSNVSERPIPAELMPHIFDAFRTAGQPGGFGLGLYICQQIARAHHAEIQVCSDVERTTFTVRLPYDFRVEERRPF